MVPVDYGSSFSWRSFDGDQVRTETLGQPSASGFGGIFTVPGCLASLKAWNPLLENIPECSSFTAEGGVAGV